MAEDGQHHRGAERRYPRWRATRSGALPADAADAPPGPLDDAASAPLRWPLTAHATKRLTSGATTMIGRGCRSHSYSDAKRRLSLDCGITDQHPKRGVMTYMQHLEHITAVV